MEKENFRVLLDLSNLKDRKHSFVWMLISTLDFKNIADFKNAIIKKLDLNENRIELFVNGGLLLDEEKIVILRENDTVQVRYEKSQNSIYPNSSSIEVEDSRLSLNSEKSNGAKSVKDSKKHKKRKESSVQEVYQELIQHETSLDVGNQVNQLNNSNDMEVDCPRLSLNAEKCNGNKTSKHSKKHKKRKETNDFPIYEENQMLVQNETPQDSSTRNSSYVNIEDNKLSITADSCNENITTKHSKNHKKRNDEADLFLADVSKDINMSKKKRKSEEASADTFEKFKNSSLSNGFTVESIVSFEKRNQYAFESVTKAVPNETNNKVEEDNVSNVSVSCKKPENHNVIGDNKPMDISVDSSVQSNNCKKRKRKRHRKRKTAGNLLAPFMSANVSTLQDFAAEDSKAPTPCNEYTGIRKHIRFTSPDRENIAKEIKTKEAESNSSSSESESSFRKIELSPRGQLLQESIASAIAIADKVTSKFCTSPNSNIILPSSKALSLTANGFTQSISSKPNNVPGSSATTTIKPMLNFTNTSWKTNAEQKLVHKSCISESPKACSAVSIADYPLASVQPPSGTHIAFKLLELGENYSPEVSDYKEGVIKSINPCNDMLEIELINTEIKPGRTGKFEILKEDEEPPEEIIEKVTVPWSSLIEPRIFSDNITKN